MVQSMLPVQLTELTNGQQFIVITVISSNYQCHLIKSSIAVNVLHINVENACLNAAGNANCVRIVITHTNCGGDVCTRLNLVYEGGFEKYIKLELSLSWSFKLLSVFVNVSYERRVREVKISERVLANEMSVIYLIFTER